MFPSVLRGAIAWKATSSLFTSLAKTNQRIIDLTRRTLQEHNEGHKRLEQIRRAAHRHIGLNQV